MSELFDFEKCQKQKQDAFAVIGDAIRKQYPDEKIPANLARVMAKIIDDGFLDCVLEQQRELIRHNDNRLYELKRLVHEYENKASKLLCEIRQEEYRLDVLQEEIKTFSDDIAEETDPLLIGAKKAYHFVEQRTRNSNLAAKAFDAYLMAHGRTDNEKAAQS